MHKHKWYTKPTMISRIKSLHHNYKFQPSGPRSGLSLVELTIVLGISSLLVAGSFAWFSSKRSTDFYDSMRQVESAIREAQSEISSNYLPGQAPGCQTEARTACPVGKNELIFAVGVGVKVATSANSETDDSDNKLYISNIKASTDPITKKISAVNAGSYGSREVLLPSTMKFAGYRVSLPPCNRPTYDDWTRLNATETLKSAFNDAGIITFRKEPNVMNSFVGSTSGWATDYATGWGGDDPVRILASNRGAVTSIPCAVMWQFESLEKAGGNPRFTAEIVYDLTKRTTKLQTR